MPYGWGGNRAPCRNQWWVYYISNRNITCRLIGISSGPLRSTYKYGTFPYHHHHVCGYKLRPNGQNFTEIDLACVKILHTFYGLLFDSRCGPKNVLNLHILTHTQTDRETCTRLTLYLFNAMHCIGQTINNHRRTAHGTSHLLSA